MNSFIQTKNYRSIKEACDNLMNSYISIEMAEITGPAGRGKTTSVQHYISSFPSSIYLRFNENLRFGNRLFSEVAFKLSGTRVDQSKYAWQIIEKSLNEKRIMIFIDEADRMSLRHLNAMRDIHDNFQTPVIFVGEEPLIEKIDSERRLRDRLAFRYQFSPIAESDIIIIFKQFGIDLDSLPQNEMIKALTKLKEFTTGTFRPVVSKAREASQILSINSMDKINLQVIETICKR